MRKLISKVKVTFEVFNRDGRYIEEEDLFDICKETWAKDLLRCDISGFAVDCAGNLILMDDCGNFAYCPEGRFKIVFNIKTE